MAGLFGEIRRTFVRGILLILPLAITFLILRWLFRFITGFSSPGAERLLRAMGAPEFILSFLTPLIAVAITIALVMLLGLIGGHYVGRRILHNLEALLLRLPIIRWFYGSARQLMDAFRYSGQAGFNEVVLVEYPRRGIWCLGFVTAAAKGQMAVRADEECVYVFLPTTPNPTSGYTIIVPRSEIRMMDMTVEEGLKVIFSGGFISPGAEAGPAGP